MKQHNILPLFHGYNWIKEFFQENDFLEVPSPPLVSNPGMEPHIHPFTVSSTYGRNQHHGFLNTSPEFWMKNVLALGLKNIYTLNYSFRDEPKSDHHRSQFLMLEWYRAGHHYSKIMEDCRHLILFLEKKFQSLGYPKITNGPIPIKTIQEIFSDILNIDIFNYLQLEEIKQLMKTQFSSLYVEDEKMSWDDYYFLLFLNLIEPQLNKYPVIILKEFPYHLRALSTLKKDNPKVAERFEIYINGVEIGNCFNEVTSLEDQKIIFKQYEKEKQNLYQYHLPEPTLLYQALEKGLPFSSGIAIGVERLISSMMGLREPIFTVDLLN